jgi:hypothetical protein
MSEKTWATDAASLNSGMFKDAVWVESIVSPFCNMTRNGCLVCHDDEERGEI